MNACISMQDLETFTNEWAQFIEIKSETPLRTVFIGFRNRQNENKLHTVHIFKKKIPIFLVCPFFYAAANMKTILTNCE